MTELDFRPVCPEDAGQIAGIYNHYVVDTDISFETEPLSAEQMRQRIETLTEQGPYIVCEAGGRIIGYAYAHRWKERAAYSHTLETTVYLRSECTGRGVGRELMLRLIDECRSRGVHALIACITVGNERSIHLHKSLGFTEVSHFIQVGRKHGRWLDVVDMELVL